MLNFLINLQNAEAVLKANIKTVLASDKKCGVMRLYLSRRGVRVMSTKIAKKILAATLALLNVFTVVSAVESVKNEESPAVPANVENKEPNRKSTWKKLITGTAITAGIITSLTVVDAQIKDLLCLKVIFECYSFPKFRDRIRGKSTAYIEKVFNYLFDVIEGKKEGKCRRIHQCLDYISFF